MLNRIDLSRADLNLLVLFETVLEERHVGRAAERLHLTPSAVSHGLGRLRRWLGDPLFLKTPKGVVPTERAQQLAAPIADVLARVRAVVADAGPFDAATSARRFTLGAPDGVSAVVLPPLRAAVQGAAPQVDLALRQLLPAAGEKAPERAWQGVWSELEARAMDAAILPLAEAPLRFARHTLYHEDFVVVARRGHAFARAPSVEGYCAAPHVVVSQSGDAYGFVDDLLARQRRTRRVALTVPNFMFALATVADSDCLCAVPRRLAAAHAARFGLAAVQPPLPLGHFDLGLFVPRAALSDAGVAWFVAQVQAMGQALRRAPSVPSSTA